MDEIPEESEPCVEKRNRGIYLLPNLFTTATLFFGFYAMIKSTNDQFDHAAIAIIIAMIMDGLDGRIARLTNTQTDFGAEYDSMSDLIAFGMAPAMVMYEFALNNLGKVGWFAAFVYTAGTALRLARFNTQVGIADKRFFQGLPSPSAAAIMAGFVWVLNDLGVKGGGYDVVAVFITISIGLIMVSNIRYHSFKEIDFKGKVRFVYLIMMMVFLAVVVLQPAVLFFSFLIYGLSGPVMTLMHLKQAKNKKLAEK